MNGDLCNRIKGGKLSSAKTKGTELSVAFGILALSPNDVRSGQLKERISVFPKYLNSIQKFDGVMENFAAAQSKALQGI